MPIGLRDQDRPRDETRIIERLTGSPDFAAFVHGPTRRPWLLRSLLAAPRIRREVESAHAASQQG
jgi:hypothetical protein